VQGIADQPRLADQPAEFGDLPVRGHSSLGDLPDSFPDEQVLPRRPGGLLRRIDHILDRAAFGIAPASGSLFHTGVASPVVRSIKYDWSLTMSDATWPPINVSVPE